MIKDQSTSEVTVSDTSFEHSVTDSGDVKRTRYYGIVMMYLLLYGVFLILMSSVDNSSTPLALPFLFILLIYESKKGKTPFEGIGLKKSCIKKEISIGIIVGLAIAFVTYFSLVWNILSGQATGDLTSSFVFAEGFSYPVNLILEVIYIFAFLTPAEEILFRGYIQGSLEKRTSRGIAVLVQSGIFGLLHIAIMVPFLPILFCIIYGSSAFLIAVVFGILFALRDGNVLASWTAHGIVNSIAAAIVMVSLVLI